MKALRVVLWCAGILLVLLAVLLAVALNSSFQTWAARRALAARPDVRGTVGTVHAGFNQVTVREARFETHGAVLTLPALEADLPVIAAGVQKRVAVKRLVAKGWTLDLTHARDAARLAQGWSQRSDGAADGSPRVFSLLSTAHAAEAAAAKAATTQAFRGVFAVAQLPIDLELDRVDLAGEVILPPIGGEGSAHLQVTLTGGGLAAGRDATFNLDVAGAKADGGSITLRATVGATLDTPRTFVRLSTRANAAASGVQFPQGVSLDVDAQAERTATGERYSAVLSGANKELAMFKGEFLTATAHVAGDWKLDLHDTDVSPFLFGRKLPVFAANGAGKVDTTARMQEIHVSGQLNAAAERLEVLRRELAAVGPMQLAAQFDVWHHADSIRVERLDASLSAAAPVASVRALQPFEFNVATAELRVADPAKDLIGIALAGVPLAWAQPFLGDIKLTGGDMHGDFAASARDGGLALRARTPLTIGGVTVAKGQEVLLRDVDIALNASADYTPRGWQAEIVELGLRSHSVSLLRLDARAGQLTGSDQAIKATGRWQANLPGWSSQPVTAALSELAQGTAQGEFSASLAGTKALESKLTLTGLIARTNEALPTITSELRADVTSDGKTAFTVPLLFQLADRRSDLLLAGTLTSGPSVSQLDARLTGDLVYVDDVKLLGLLVPRAPTETRPTPAPKPNEPFWSKWTGQIALALKKVIYGGSLEIAEVAGTIRLDPTALNLVGLRAAFGTDSDLKMTGGVKFNGAQTEAYQVGVDVALNNFDTGAAFRAVDPTKLPTVEGRVNLTTHLAGSGADVGQAASRARGDLQVTGRSGIFRALSADVADKVQRTQSTVAAIGGILGAMTGKKEYVDYAEKTQIVTEITKALSEIPFDQLNVTATRDAALNVTLKDFTMISPEVRLTGAGGIQYQDAKSLLEQPLQLQLQLGARGKLGELLDRAGLLEAKQDSLGYTGLIKAIDLRGSLSKTDASGLVDLLLSSTLFK